MTDLSAATETGADTTVTVDPASEIESMPVPEPVTAIQEAGDAGDGAAEPPFGLFDILRPVRLSVGDHNLDLPAGRYGPADMAEASVLATAAQNTPQFVAHLRAAAHGAPPGSVAAAAAPPPPTTAAMYFPELPERPDGEQ